MVNPDPSKRITMEQVLAHPYWAQSTLNINNLLPSWEETMKILRPAFYVADDIAGKAYKKRSQDPCASLNYVSESFFEPLDAESLEQQESILSQVLTPDASDYKPPRRLGKAENMVKKMMDAKIFRKRVQKARVQKVDSLSIS